MKSAGKARNNGLYRHIRTSKEIIRNLLNDYFKYLKKRDSECYFVPTHIFIITLVKKMYKTTLADCFHKCFPLFLNLIIYV